MTAAHLFRPLRVFSTFSGGVDGWSRGLHSTGRYVTVALCEADAERRKMLAKQFPGVKIYEDIRHVTAARLRADGVGKIDIIAGSPPCPDYSEINKKRPGLEGETGVLFLEWLRLVGEIRPRGAFAENSPRVSSHDLNRLLDGLETYGYRTQPLYMEALAFGSPHKRKRLWLIAWDAAQIGRPLRASEPAQKPTRAPRQSRQKISDHVGDARDYWGPSWREALGRSVSLANGLSAGMAETIKQALGDAILPQIAEAIGNAFIAAEDDAAQHIAKGRA